GDLGAGARVPGAADDLDEPLVDFGHLDLEELDEQFRRRAAEEQLGTAGLRPHFPEVGAQAIAGAHCLARDHLVARNEGLGVAAQVEDDTAALHALDGAAHHLADAVLVRLDDLVALGLAHLLHDDLLGGLRRDAPELHRRHGLLHEAAYLDFGIAGARVAQANLP